MVGFSPNVEADEPWTNERTVCGEAWPNDFACYTWIIQFLFLFYILFCAHSLETNERIFHFCSAAHGMMPLSNWMKILPFLSSFDLRDRIFKKTTKHLFIFFSSLGWIIQKLFCMNVWIIHIVLPPTIFNPYKQFFFFGETCFGMIFSPLEKEIYLGPVFLSCYCAAGETADANDRLDPQSVVRHSTIFSLLTFLNIFYIHPRQNRDFGGLGCRDSFFFYFREEKTGPKSNSNAGFYSIAVKWKLTCFVFQVDGKDDIF